VKKPIGLRERQRLARRQAILFAAGDLFASKGFDTTSLEDVAAAASLSIPTIYTFFKSKQDLLLGLLEEDRFILEPKLEKLVEDLPDDPAEAFYAIGRSIIADGYDVTRKNVWREILAASLRSSSEERNQFRELQSVSARYIGLAVEGLQQRGRLPRELDRDSAVRIVHGIIRRIFQIYIVNDSVSFEDMLAMLRTDLKYVTKGLEN
jgi:AcrR family transcriptional regulator